jgi:hypothetical protein
VIIPQEAIYETGSGILWIVASLHLHSSTDGSRLAVASLRTRIPPTSALSGWTSLASSSDGSHLAASAHTEKVLYEPKGELYTSSDGGLTWTRQDGAPSGTMACTSGSEIFVARHSPIAAEMATRAVTMDGGLRVRASPDLKGEVLGRLGKGDRLQVLERSERKVKVESMETYWYRIWRLSDTLTGWVYGYNLKLED